MERRLRTGIQLERKNPNFWPGELVKGHLFVQTHQYAQSLSELTLVLHGEAANLVERRNYLLKRHYNYRQTEVYVDTYRSLQNLAVVPNPDMLTTGMHAFEFQLMLPAGIPPTFLGTYGNIGYSLSVCRGRQCLFRMAIYVHASLNVLRLPAAQEILMREVESVSGGCLVRNVYNVHLRVWLEKGGCCLRGEKIPLHLEINNSSEVMVAHTRLTLKQTVQFFSHGESEKSTHTVPMNRDFYLSRVTPHSTVTWNPDDVSFTLPAKLPVSGPPGCSIIKLSYELVVKVVLAGCCNSVTLRLPLTVGAAPPEAVQAEIQKNLDTQRTQAAAALLAALGCAVEELQTRGQEARASDAHEA